MITLFVNMRSVVHSTVAFAILLTISFLFSSSSAFAESGRSSELVNSLPAEIPEILTGGSWSNGSIGGVYRAVVVMSKPVKSKLAIADKAKTANSQNEDETERKAEVFVQWISHENGKATPKIVKTVSIKEFNEKELRHAFLAMDTLTENEMTLLVTSYDDRSDKDVTVSIKATAPGKYTQTKTEK